MSTEVTTEMMNEVIARFMGGTRIQHPEQKFFSEDHFGYVCHKGHWWNERNLQYHTSWDWLMPVVIRIKNDESLRLRAPCLGITDSIWPYINAMKYMNQRLLKADITGTHAGVYQFITWFNQQKQTNDKK